MRKSFLFLMALVCMLIVPGCGLGVLGGSLGSLLIDGGLSLVISLLWSAISGSLGTPAA